MLGATFIKYSCGSGHPRGNRYAYHALYEARNSIYKVREPAGKIVLFGAGRLGRKVLQGLRANGVEPLAFCDNNQKLWAESMEDVTVLSPRKAGGEFGKTAVFVVCV